MKPQTVWEVTGTVRGRPWLQGLDGRDMEEEGMRSRVAGAVCGLQRGLGDLLDKDSFGLRCFMLVFCAVNSV